MTNWAAFGLHSTISTLSPAISLETLCTRAPRTPTQAPIGSILASTARTAIFALNPGSRAALRISISPSRVSGTSSLNSSISNSGQVRFKINWGPRGSDLTSLRITRIRSPCLKPSLAILSLLGNKASTPSISTMTSPRSTRRTIPKSIFPLRGSNSFSTRSRSASRTFCITTWRAAAAEILSVVLDGIIDSTNSPT